MTEQFDQDAELNNLESYEKSLAWWQEEVIYNKQQFLSSLAIAGFGLGVDVARSITYSISTRNPAWLGLALVGSMGMAYGCEAVHEFKDVTDSVGTLAVWEDIVAREKQEAREE